MPQTAMTREVAIRRATRDDAGRLNAALRELSWSMGDAHRATDADVARAGFGPVPAFHALIAERAEAVCGVALYSPVYSTVRGKAGAYVSDLWVAEAARGQRLGERLLAQVLAQAGQGWGAAFLRLAVYDDNPRARAFYERLGFGAHADETYLTLDGSALDALKG